MTATVERFVCSIPGNPGEARINRWTRSVRTATGVRVVKREEYRRWSARASMIARVAASGLDLGDGPLHAEIVAYWPRVTRSGAAAGLAFGDVDATAKAVLDALEDAGVIRDDGQIETLTLRKAHSPKAPRIDVEVWRA